MPTYDYVCTVCGHRLEVMHGVHGHGPAACPVCGGEMRKAFAPPAVVFKGSGWARKDRGSSSGRRSNAPASGEAASEASSSGGAAATSTSAEKGSGGSGESASGAGGAKD